MLKSDDTKPAKRNPDWVNRGATFHQSFDSWPEDKQLDVVVVNYNGKDVGFVVDKLLQQKEIVEKPLMKPVDTGKLISGVTILGNGNVCLVINVISIVQHIFNPVVARV